MYYSVLSTRSVSVLFSCVINRFYKFCIKTVFVIFLCAKFNKLINYLRKKNTRRQSQERERGSCYYKTKKNIEKREQGCESSAQLQSANINDLHYSQEQLRRWMLQMECQECLRNGYITFSSNFEASAKTNVFNSFLVKKQ